MIPLNDNDNDELNESDGEESTISLSDFPTAMTAAASDGHHSSTELFEFSTASAKTDDMWAADDVIFHGKILPLAALPPPQHKRTETHVSISDEFDHQRRSNSLGDPPPRGFWDGKGTGEYRKLKRVADPDPKGAAPVDPLKPRPRWYVLVFGSVKIPAAMELKEIRIRQRRRSAPPLERKEEWGPWKLLRSLSCKGMEAVVVS